MHLVAYTFFNFQAVGINDSDTRRRVYNCLNSQKVENLKSFKFLL